MRAMLAAVVSAFALYACSAPPPQEETQAPPAVEEPAARLHAVIRVVEVQAAPGALSGELVERVDTPHPVAQGADGLGALVDRQRQSTDDLLIFRGEGGLLR